MMKGPDLQVVVSVILTEYPGMEGGRGDPQGEKRSLADKTVTFCVGVAFDRVWGSCGGQLVLVIGTEK